MIERLPLNVFGEEDESAEQSAAPAGERPCAWCATPIPEGADRCPACGALVGTSPALTVPDALDVAAAALAPPVPVEPVVPVDNAQMVTCQWCVARVPVGTEICPNCQGRLVPIDARAGELYGTNLLPVDATKCQWCGATVAADAEVCPVCGGVVRGDTSLLIPGLTEPLPEWELRRGSDSDAGAVEGEVAGLVADIVVAVLKDVID